jgi:hypothetical protein
MRQWVQEAGKSEGYAVMAWIAVQTLPHLKRGRLPTGVSSRKTWTNDLDMGKQMTADFGLAGAPMSRNAWLLPPIIVKSIQLYWRVSLSRRAFEMLEPIALKGARWVLRGGSAAMSLPYPTTGRLGLGAFFRHCSKFEQFPVSYPFSPQPPVT